MSAYLDTSVIISILNDEAASLLVAHFLKTTTESVVVSEFAATEVASTLSRLVRIGLLNRQDALQRLADFDAWRAGATSELDIQPSDVRLATIFVRRFDLMLRAPDALHAAMCSRTGHFLVTLDRRLAAAAEALGVSVRRLA